MTKLHLALAFTSSLALIGCQQVGQKDVKLESDKDKMSYTIGHQIGSGMKKQNMDVNPQVIAVGIADALADKEKLDQKAMREVMRKHQQQRLAKSREEAESNKAAGLKFLEENKKKDGVKVTESGLQYEVLTAGTGKKPTDKNTVKVHYKGTLIDGSEFDSSFKRNKPAEFPVTGVIKGWTEALQMMKTGAKWKLYIPSDLAYGDRGRPSIPANSTLIFEVELLEIVK